MISIITPTYNRAHLISKMVNSVISQTYKEWELLVIDDGSTDQTEKVLLRTNDPRIRYFKEKNQGATIQRNFGVSMAKGDYIVFLDSDDWVEPNWLELLTANLNKSNTQCIATCGWRKINQRSKEIEKKYPENLGKMFNNLRLNFLAGTFLFPKSYFIEVGGYDEELSSGQHTELLIRLLDIIDKYKPEIYVIEELLVNIYAHDGHRIRQDYNGIYNGSIRTLNKHNKLFKRNPEKHFDYLSIAAVCAFRTGRIKESKKLTRQVIRIRPFYYLSYLRYFIAHISLLRNRIWTKK